MGWRLEGCVYKPRSSKGGAATRAQERHPEQMPLPSPTESRRNQPRDTLVPDTLVSRAVRESISVLLGYLVHGYWSRQPQDIGMGCNERQETHM